MISLHATTLTERTVPRWATILVWAIAKGAGLAGSVFTGLVTAGIIATAAGKDLQVSNAALGWTLVVGLLVSVCAWATERYVDDDLRHS